MKHITAEHEKSRIAVEEIYGELRHFLQNGMYTEIKKIAEDVQWAKRAHNRALFSASFAPRNASHD